MSHPGHPLHPSRFSLDEETQYLLDDTAAGIRRSRNAIARTANYVEIAQRFLLESRRGRRLNPDAVLARRA